MNKLFAEGMIAERIHRLSESATLAMASKARELESRGVRVIKLSLGEPDFPTPEHIKAAAKQAIDDDFSFYTPVPAYMGLREAIAQKLRNENNIPAEANNIVVSTGAKQALMNAILCLVNPGDEVVIFSPYWVSYLAMVEMAEAKPIFLQGSIEQQFKILPEQLEAAITPKTKLVLYSSPSNPTGTVYSKQELRAFADILQRHPQIFVVSDEIYEYINFGEAYYSMGAFEDMHHRVVTVNGFSKGFAMTGWRVGYLHAPPAVAQACIKLQGQFTSATCSIAQKAAYAAITGDRKPVEEMREAFRRRRDLVLNLLSHIPGIKTYKPQGAFYIFPDVSSYFGKRYNNYYIQDSNDLCMYLLNEAHVALVAGDAFGAPGCIRISFAASETDLQQALSNIKDKLALLH